MEEKTKKILGRAGLILTGVGAAVAVIAGVSAETVSGVVTGAVGLAAGAGALLALIFRK